MSQFKFYTECVILGACLIDSAAFSRVNKILNASYFTDNNVQVWEAIEEVYINKLPVDILTVSKNIMENIHADNSIDTSYKIISIHLMKLTEKVSSTANLEYHALVLIELYIKYSLKQLSFIYKKQGMQNLQFAEDMGELFNMLMAPTGNPLEILFSTVSYLRINYPNESELYQSILDLSNEFTQQALVVKRELGTEKKELIKPIITTTTNSPEQWPEVSTKNKERAKELKQQIAFEVQETLIFGLNV